ncbi:MAG: PQQ-binding-like beta-propeller repeat protein [Pirellulales bacterium]|nr:PQQ-binding-like beta-propeller repeat protein [Pirellulales bacterium]
MFIAIKFQLIAVISRFLAYRPVFFGLGAPRAGIGFSLCCLLSVALPPLYAQPVGGLIQARETGDGEKLGVFPYDRNLTNLFDKCKKLIEQENYADGLEGLDRLLGEEKDSALKPVKGQEKYQSLKTEVLNLIGGLSPAGMAEYQLQFGAVAEKHLKEALLNGDTSKLEFVVRRYFHTPAGYQAAYLLARRHMDQGRPLAAALLCKRLLAAPAAATQLNPQLSVLAATAWHRSGVEDESVKLLEGIPPPRAGDFPNQVPSWSASAAGIQQWLKNHGGPISQLASLTPREWIMFRGNPGRNASMAGGAPLLNPRWHTSIVTDPQMSLALYEDRRNYLNQGLPAIPALQALAIGKQIIYRTPSRLQPIVAVDFDTGKLSWYVGQSTVLGGGSGFKRDNQSARAGLNERSWSNLNNGGLSSDSQRIFFVEDDPSSGNEQLAQAQMFRMNPFIARRGWMNSGEVSYAPGANRLFACDIPTQGKLQWVVGGTDSETEPRLANVVFLGPPLPLQGTLYVLAEIKQSICLLALQATTGKLLWQQELILLNEEVNALSLGWRRTVGLTPSYAEGLLLCPTGTGGLVAVDLTNRTMSWAFLKQNTNSSADFNQQIMQGAMYGNGGGMLPGSAWTESTAVVAGNKVILTSSELEKLICLDLTTGTVVWEKPRGRGLYVGGIVQDQVIVIGRQEVTAFKLADGQLAWPSDIKLPGNAVPTGRGFISQADYFLPLSSSEVVCLDLVKGEVKSRSRSSTGTIPGNLICHRGHVLSLNIDRLEKYAQADLLRAQVREILAREPSNWQALAWRGEIALDDGDLAGAMKDLRLAWDQVQALARTENSQGGGTEQLRYEGESDHLRGLLFMATAEAIRSDYGGKFDLLADLQKLIGTPAEKSNYLRIAAEGQERRQDWEQAFAAYLELADLQTAESEREEIDLSYDVHRGLWIQARLQELWQKLTPAIQNEWNGRIATRWQRALSSSGGERTAAVERFLSLFGFLPATDAAREQLLAYLGSESPLRSEALLKELENSADPAIRRRALARLAALYHGGGRLPEAARYYRILRDECGDQICLENQTGLQWYQSVPEDSPLGKILRAGTSWNNGLVTASFDKSSGSNINRIRGNQPALVRLEVTASEGTTADQLQIMYDSNNAMLMVRDQEGRTLRQVPLNNDGTLNFGFNPQTCSVMLQNHLLILNLGWKIVAIDLLGELRREKPFLWHYDFVDPQQMQAMNQYGNGPVSTTGVNEWGLLRRGYINPNTKEPFGTVALCGSRGVAVLRHRELSLLHPQTGEALWTRRNLAGDQVLYGDHELLFLVNKAGKQAQVYRTLDGKLLGERDLPPRDRILAAAGRKLVSWDAQPAGHELSLVDAHSGEKTLLGKFSLSKLNGTTRLFLPDGQTLIVATQDDQVGFGRFEGYSLIDGRRLFSTRFIIEGRIKSEGKLKGARLLADSQRYYLFVQSANFQRDTSGNVYTMAMHDGSGATDLWNGQVHAFDRKSGGALWPTPVNLRQNTLWTGQPTELPVLVFVRGVQRQKNRNQQTLSITCIDKQTGRLIYLNDEIRAPIYGYDIQAEPENQLVKIIAPDENGNSVGTVIKLQYTTQARPPEPPYQAGLAVTGSALDRSKSLGPLVRGLNRTIQPQEEDSPFDDDKPKSVPAEVQPGDP